MESLQQNKQNMSQATFQLLYNKWVNEITKMMLAAEKLCNKFMDGLIDWSPAIGIWINRMQAYLTLSVSTKEKSATPRNLFRTCKRYEIRQPRDMMERDLEARTSACIQMLASLKTTAPAEHRKQLRSCLDKASDNGNSKAAKAIKSIL